MSAPKPMETCCCGSMGLRTGVRAISFFASAVCIFDMGVLIYTSENTVSLIFPLFIGVTLVIVCIFSFIGASLSKRMLLWPFMAAVPLVGILLNFVSAVFFLLSIRVGIQTKTLGEILLNGVLRLVVAFLLVYFWVVVASLYIKLGNEYDENMEDCSHSYRKSRGEQMMPNAYVMDGIVEEEGRLRRSTSKTSERQQQQRQRQIPNPEEIEMCL